jgi:microcin C transport system permease protein
MAGASTSDTPAAAPARPSWLARSPLLRRQLQRFRRIRRGYWSTLALALLLLLSAGAELLVNSRALVVHHDGEWLFPTYGEFIPGTRFGFEYDYETNYRALAQRIADDDAARASRGEAPSGDFVLLPPVPWSPYETDYVEGSYPPYPPSSAHWLGTDTTGRDVLARLFYGFRTAMLFSIALLLCTYLIGVSVGCAMGYFGGALDLIGQRLIEVWSNIPFLYVIMIIASIVVPSFGTLVLMMVLFGWMGMTWYMRTSTYREKARDYVLAARALGAGPVRVIFRHILPNTLSLIVTFVPFSIAGGITALTALDYLCFGLPPPTPSWGELLAQGTANLDSPWIVGSVVLAMSAVLLMVTFIGEAVREAFDPRKYSHYE